MLQSEVINKLAHECCLAMGDFTYYKTVHTYIQMALAVGIEHFHKLEEEIVALDRKGIEAGRFKSVQAAAKSLGIYPSSITEVLKGNRPTAGGFRFIKVKDYELIEREHHHKLDIIPLK